MNQSTSAGWGILGTGRAARDFIRDLRHVQGARAAAIGSRNRDRAERLASVMGVPRAHESYEALVADASVDIVYVATPNAMHSQHCLMALEAGKPVLCEKPFAVSAQEAHEVMQAARRQKLFCMEAMWMHFVPGMRKAIELVRSGAIGQPQLLIADFGTPLTFDPSSRVYDPVLGGGAMLDRGVYPLALAWRLFGCPERVQASGRNATTGVDEHCSAIVTYRGGEVAFLSATLTGYATNAAVVVGSEGRLTIHEPFCRPDDLTVCSAPKSHASSGADSSSAGRLREHLKSNRAARALWRLVSRRCRTIRVPYEGNGLNYEAFEAMTCIKNGMTESAIWSLDDTVGVMRTLDDVRSACG